MTKIKIRKLNDITEEKYKQIDELTPYGLVKFIDGYPAGVTFDSKVLIEQFDVDFHFIRKQLDKLSAKKILNLRLVEDADIILEIDFLTSSDVKNDDVYNKFEIDNTSFQNILNMSSVNGKLDDEKFQTYLYSFIQSDVSTFNHTVINSEEEYIMFLSSVRPQDYISSVTGQSINNNQFLFLYKMLYEYNFNKELVNLAIDYTISTNVYGTFNVKFASSLMYGWKRNNINDLVTAIKYIKDSKQKIIEKKDDNLFIEPVWEEQEIIISSNTNSSDDVFALLDKAYNE